MLGGVMFGLNALSYIPQPFAVFCCLGCLVLAAPMGGGFLAGRFDQPITANLAARAGAGAGAIGGVGAFAAHLILGMLLLILGGPEAAADRALQVGITIPANADPFVFYGGAVGGVGCLGLFLVVLFAGVGALGGLLWHQTARKKSAPAAM